MQVTVTVLLEQPDGQLQESTREFGTFRADRLALAEWLNSLNVERVVMERTGIGGGWAEGSRGQCASGQAGAGAQNRPEG